MQLPQNPFHLEDGSSVLLKDLASHGPIVLVFLRHFGCIFCRYQVAQLRSGEDLPIYFVCMERPDEAAAFKQKMRSPHHFISDPDRVLYEACGVHKGTVKQLFSFKSVAQGVRATLAGFRQGRPTSDASQLGAVIILREGGSLGWSKYAEHAGEIFSLQMIREQLAGVIKPKVRRAGEDDPGMVEGSAPN